MKENDRKTTDISSVVTIDVEERSNKISPISKTDNEPLDAVEQEKQRMARKAEKRHQHLRDILMKVNSNGYPFYVAFYGLIGILLGVFLLCILALIPRHDVIKDPEYFYEGAGITLLITSPFFVVSYLASAIMVLNIDCLKLARAFVVIASMILIYRISIMGIVNLFWVYIAEFRYPMPFHALIDAYLTYPCFIYLLWRQMPEKWRSSKEFKKRFLFYILRTLISTLISFEYQALNTLIVNSTETWQPLMFASMAFVREFNIWISTKIAYKAAGAKDASVEIFISFNENTRHAMYLSSTLGSAISDTSTAVILAFDLVINIFITGRIMWLKRKANFAEKIDEAESHLISLLINEMVEAITPFAFLICLLLTYYGPNAHLFGNVGSSHFHYKPVEDIGKYVQNLWTFFIVDVLCLIVTSALLWFVSRINILKAYMVIVKEFWPFISMITSTWILLVSIYFKIISIECRLFNFFFSAKRGKRHQKQTSEF